MSANLDCPVSRPNSGYWNAHRWASDPESKAPLVAGPREHDTRRVLYGPAQPTSTLGVLRLPETPEAVILNKILLAYLSKDHGNKLTDPAYMCR